MTKSDKSQPPSMADPGTVQPRVRRDLDPRPVQQRPPELKVRPFEEWFPYENRQGALVIRGRLEGDGFVVEVGSLPPVLLSPTHFRDAAGVFALLAVGSYQLAPRRLLCVELDAQDSDSDYASIVYRELYSDCAEYEREGAAVRSYSVFFNPRGDPDGSAASLPRSVRPQGPAS